MCTLTGDLYKVDLEDNGFVEYRNMDSVIVTIVTEDLEDSNVNVVVNRSAVREDLFLATVEVGCDVFAMWVLTSCRYIHLDARWSSSGFHVKRVERGSCVPISTS